jgi:hypothetical protein
MDSKITRGIIILIIGVALIIISPNLLFTETVGRDRVFGFPVTQTTDLRNMAMFFGVVLLIVGGITSALGFSIKDVGTSRQQPVGLKPCPFCAELIKKEAKVCRFCQRDLPAVNNEPKALPQAQNPLAVKAPSEIFDRYVGDYKLASNRFFIVTKEGETLMAQLGNEPQERLLPKGLTSFATENSRRYCTFVEKDGKVSHIRISEGGQEWVAQKVA